jgi:hypothetical protein
VNGATLLSFLIKRHVVSLAVRCGVCVRTHARARARARRR